MKVANIFSSQALKNADIVRLRAWMESVESRVQCLEMENQMLKLKLQVDVSRLVSAQQTAAMAQDAVDKRTQAYINAVAKASEDALALISGPHT